MKGPRPGQLFSHLIIAVLVILSLYPFLFMLMTSFKSNEQFYHHYFSFTFPFHWANYGEAWNEIGRPIWNSVTVTFVSVAGVLAISGLCAFAFARYRFRGSEVLFAVILIVLMVPETLTLISLFVILRDFGLLGSHTALYAVYISSGQVLATYILRNFFVSIPEELMEAADIDGAGDLQAAARIVLPLSGPVFATVAVMNVIAVWNDYIWPLITLPNPKLWTVTQGLATFQDRYSGMAAWGPLFAGFVIASLPLAALFAAAMRPFIAGISTGALKG